MKLLIITDYDGGVGFGVYDNGKIYSRSDIEDDEGHKFFELWLLARRYGDVNDYIIRNFGKDYDRIIYCENGSIEVLKEV